MSEELRARAEAIAEALRVAEESFAYSFNLTWLVDGEERYTLSMPGYDPVEFEDREEGYRVIAERKREARAAAIMKHLSFASSAAGQREGGDHGLGPSALRVEDDPDGFNPVIVQAGEAVYLAQADEIMVMSRSQAAEVAAIIASALASPSAPEERRDEVDYVLSKAREAQRLVQGCLECNAEDERRWAETIAWLEGLRSEAVQ